MPNRMLRDWTMSDKVNSLNVHAERFFIRLIMKADDHGCFHADTRILKANLFPLLLDTIREADLLRWMTECQKAGMIVIYESDNKKYLQIQDFRQRLDKARSKFPLPNKTDFPEVVNEFPPELEHESEVERKGTLGTSATHDPSSSEKIDLKTDPERKRNATPKFSAPTLQELKDYFTATIGDQSQPGAWLPDKCANEAAQLFNHYTANGWVQGRGKPIKDWKAACRNWIMNERKGTFAAPTVVRNQPAVNSTPQPELKPTLTKCQKEINILYEIFREDNSKVTIIGIDPLHYNCLKEAGKINFDSDKVAEIKKLSIDHLVSKNIDHNEVNELRYMKKFGVIEFFKQQQASDPAEEIFKLK